MNNNKDVNSQLSRMRSLMTFGINEGKKVSYSGVEYEKVGADGKLYGIVREGTKYYIKTSPSKKGNLTENFEYIGGFRNRKNNEYSSYAEAQKQFDLKMMSINEANAPEKKIVVESWNPDKQEELTVEATDKMKKEISRERQIMMNASRINEKKSQNLNPIGEGCCKNECDGYNFEDAKNPKDSFKNVDKDHRKPGKAAKANNGYKDAKIEEASEPLAWHSTGKDAAGNMADTYMDRSHGTKIGNSAPFDDACGKDIDGISCNAKSRKMKNGVVEEGDSMAMDNGENQNSPKVGVGKIGKNDPFNGEQGKRIEEDIDDLNSDADVEDDDVLADDGALDDGDSTEYEVEFGDDDDDDDTDPDLHDLQDQISDLSDKVDSILDAVGGDEPTVDTEEYDDDDLYDDDDDDISDDDDDDEMTLESRSFNRMRRRMNEDEMRPLSSRGRMSSMGSNRLNDFGRHPAYQKRVMSLPNTDMEEFPGYYDMNDDSVRSTAPYGKKIGRGTPFEVDPEEVKDAIAESIMRHIGKKNIR